MYTIYIDICTYIYIYIYVQCIYIKYTYTFIYVHDTAAAPVAYFFMLGWFTGGNSNKESNNSPAERPVPYFLATIFFLRH